MTESLLDGVVSGFLALVFLAVLAAIVAVLAGVVFAGWSLWWLPVVLGLAVSLRWTLAFVWPEVEQ